MRTGVRSMKKSLLIFIMVLGFPIAFMCTASLPLILLGVIQPDPHPWNWLTMYITDHLFGLSLFATLFGILFKTRWGKTVALITIGYALFAFSQTALEATLNITGWMEAPISAPVFILTFMVLGFALGAAILLFTILYPAHWQIRNNPA